jgi:hypothetical protein
MNTKLLSMARRSFCHATVPVSTQRHNIRAWARSLRFLGSKWLLATPIKVQREV